MYVQMLEGRSYNTGQSSAFGFTPEEPMIDVDSEY